MNKSPIRVVTKKEVENIYGGAAITIGFVCAVLSIAILSVFVWKFFTADKGKASFPGGFTFEWGVILNYFLGLFK